MLLLKQKGKRKDAAFLVWQSVFDTSKMAPAAVAVVVDHKDTDTAQKDQWEKGWTGPSYMQYVGYVIGWLQLSFHNNAAITDMDFCEVNEDNYTVHPYLAQTLLQTIFNYWFNEGYHRYYHLTCPTCYRPIALQLGSEPLVFRFFDTVPTVILW